MKYCSQCGTANGDNDVFCKNCGNKLSEADNSQGGYTQPYSATGNMNMGTGYVQNGYGQYGNNYGGGIQEGYGQYGGYYSGNGGYVYGQQSMPVYKKSKGVYFVFGLVIDITALVAFVTAIFPLHYYDYFGNLMRGFRGYSSLFVGITALIYSIMCVMNDEDCPLYISIAGIILGSLCVVAWIVFSFDLLDLF